MRAELKRYLDAAASQTNGISKERRALLNELAQETSTRLISDGMARLTFVCTHNSRRSHLAQVWAWAAATYHELDGIESFSGGTEVTACNERTVAALRRAGFAIDELPNEDNPHYRCVSGENTESKLWSKLYDENPNPVENFMAVMTCSSADEACPYIPGAKRFAVRYDDPKISDDTEMEAQTYDERCRQIAVEMMYFTQNTKRFSETRV